MRTEQVADGTFCVVGGLVNWVVLVEAVLVTHAHVDHVGTLPALVGRHGTRVLTGPTEARHARRELLEQASAAAVLAKAWHPRWVAWLARAVRVGVASQVAVPSAGGVDHGLALDLPGAPVPVATPGHTSGHTAFALPAVGAVVTGDAVVTGHPTSSRTGPQTLDDVFHHHPAGARGGALDTLAALDADVLLPGHGPVHRGRIDDAVARARAPS